MENKTLTGYPSIDKPWEKCTKKYKSTMPNCEMAIYAFIYAANRNHLDEPALIYDLLPDCKPTLITYRELFCRINDCARAYCALGIGVKDIVTICLPSSIEGIVSIYALNKIGAIANLIHPIASRDEIALYLEEAQSKVLVCYPSVLERVEEVQCSSLETVIVVSLSDEFDAGERERVLTSPTVPTSVKALFIQPTTRFQDGRKYMSWMEFIKNEASACKINPDDVQGKRIAVLTHTSGTAGRSKAVATSSFAINKSVDAAVQETQLFQRGDCELLVVPPYPLYSVNNTVHFSISVGIGLIVAPLMDLSRMSVYFKKYSIQHMKGIPLHIDAILNDDGFNDVDLSRFKLLISGGGRLSDQKVQAINSFLLKHHCPYGVANGYGMSEAGGCVTCMFENTTEESTVGRPLIGNNAKIVDLDSEKELSYNEQGEVLLTGPSKMDGYYRNPEDTAAVFVEDDFGTVWLKTGDLGMITEKGNLKIIGRIKRMTLVFDPLTNTVSKVSHDHMEEFICQIAGVKNCVVVAVDNTETHNALKAYIVLGNNSYAESVQEIDGCCKQKFRKYVSPIEYIIVEHIPFTKAGKVDYQFVERFEQGLLEANAVPVLTRLAIHER